MRLPRRIGRGQRAELVDHLGELRARLVVSLVALAAAFGVAFAFHALLIGWLIRPLPPGRELVTLGVAEPFTTSIKISLYAAFLLALPVLLWQLWGFFAPGVGERVERTVGSLVGAAFGLGVAGLAFGYFVALPASISFLTNYDADLYDVQIRAADYFSFVTLVLFAVTIVFELPIAILGLVRVGALSSAKLRRNRRIGYAAVAVLAVVLPGVDPVTTLIEMIPLMVLFEATIWISVLLERRWLVAAEPATGANHA
jgi:sec-independent protein translocase protein TatC